MEAERVTFGGLGLGLQLGGTLEGLLEEPDGDVRGGVVVSHPHPLYGGTMRQPLVHRLAKACRGRGFATLRFNFRGVGRSKASFDGVAEQDDVRAAVRYMRDRFGVQVPVAGAGFSFGSMMTALAASAGEHMDAMVLVALVLRWGTFSPDMLAGLKRVDAPILAVCGERDELAPPGDVRSFLDDLGVRYEMQVVDGADHFFQGSLERVGMLAADFLERSMG